MENTRQKYNIIISVIMAITFAATALVQPVEASVKDDLSHDTSVYYQEGNNYYLLDYQPPRKYGKEFGKASDYTSSKKREVLYEKTWKKSNQKLKILKTAYNIIRKGKVTGLGTVVELMKKEVKGVKVVKTTFFNKKTGKYKVGKNKKCRKEIWEVYIKQKNSKTGKYSWKLFYSTVGFRSVITVTKMQVLHKRRWSYPVARKGIQII